MQNTLPVPLDDSTCGTGFFPANCFFAAAGEPSCCGFIAGERLSDPASVLRVALEFHPPRRIYQSTTDAGVRNGKQFSGLPTQWWATLTVCMYVSTGAGAVNWDKSQGQSMGS